jgi:peptidoglycan DL-endopeptidase CwlO
MSLVKGARQFLGVPYVYGGTDPATGLDCASSMQQVFRPFGVSLPRLAHNQGQVGQRIKKNDLQPGDLMFFDTNQGADHHVGMYAGNGKVIHESSSAGRMVEVPFTGWLANHFSHGQRVQVEVTVNHPAFKAHVKETMHEIHHENTRAHPNTRNHR